MRADPWRCALIFVAALCLSTFATGIAARYLLRPAVGGDITPKLAELAASGESFDTIAIGSSRMLHDFDPDAVAAGSSRAGCSVRAYNLGVGGLNGVEMRLLLRELAARHPPGLKRIVFDMPNHIYIQFENLRSRAVFVTTDPAETPFALADLASHPDPRKLSAFLRYGISLAYHNSAFGALAAFLQPARAPLEPAASETDDDGFAPLGEATSPTPERRYLADNRARFDDLVEGLRRQTAASAAERAASLHGRWRLAVVDRQIDFIRSLGYEPVLLLLPDTYPEAIADAAAIEAHLRAQRPDVEVINAMSAEYAGIVYDPAAWWDWTHLVQSSASRLSLRVGQELCRGRLRNALG
jgi:hypothetical protein